jgi:exonuclease III
MKVVSWNCRGMGRKVKEEAIRTLLRIETPDILLIQETKMEDKDFLQISKKFWNKGGGQVVSARGASGGLGTLWNINKYSLVTEILNTHWLFLKLQHLDTKEVFSLFNVYVPVNAGEKKACWDSIRNLAEIENLENIIIVGDLNLTLLLSEKRGGSIVRIWQGNGWRTSCRIGTCSTSSPPMVSTLGQIKESVLGILLQG